MSGVLLDRKAIAGMEAEATVLDQLGRVSLSPSRELLDASGVPYAMARNLEAGWELKQGDIPRYDELPDSVKAQIEKQQIGRHGLSAFAPMNSLLSFQETLYATIANGTAVTAAAETIMVPDFTLPANYFKVGRVLRYTVWHKQSTVITTPGTITHRLRYGGVGGTLICASGAWAPDPTAASTDLTCCVQYYVICRSDGATGTVLGFGRYDGNDFDDASATSLKGNLDMNLIPVSGAATATINTTTANAITPTYQPSVATASMTAMLAILESLS